jgi:hypothetical protein
VPRYPACRVLIHGPADPTPGGPTTVTGSRPLALPDVAPGRSVHQRCGTGDAGTATPWPTLGRGARRGAGHCGRHGDPLGVLRFDFSGDSENLRHVRWDEWFGTFDARELDCLYREQRKDGLQSTFFRLESPDREGRLTGRRPRSELRPDLRLPAGGPVRSVAPSRSRASAA